jgi:hypothetical protein
MRLIALESIGVRPMWRVGSIRNGGMLVSSTSTDDPLGAALEELGADAQSGFRGGAVVEISEGRAIVAISDPFA